MAKVLQFKVKALKRGFSGKIREAGEEFIHYGPVAEEGKKSSWLEVIEDKSYEPKEAAAVEQAEAPAEVAPAPAKKSHKHKKSEAESA